MSEKPLTPTEPPTRPATAEEIAEVVPFDEQLFIVRKAIEKYIGVPVVSAILLDMTMLMEQLHQRNLKLEAFALSVMTDGESDDIWTCPRCNMQYELPDEVESKEDMDSTICDICKATEQVISPVLKES